MTKTADNSPELRVTVFSDYICPFCYIGDARLQGLRAEYDLKVNWCFLEIHPETPVEGMSVSNLGYTDEQFREMMDGFYQMAREEGLHVAEHHFTTNSRHALLLAEATKQAGAEVFYRLHRRLFEVYFSENRNIGDDEVLKEIADECGVSPGIVQQAWTEPEFAERLARNMAAARELNVTGTPTFFFSDRPLTGAVSYSQLAAAARQGLEVQQQMVQKH